MTALADDPGWWIQVGRIVLLDLLLAGDNALVIAMAVRLLPLKEQRLGRLWGTVLAVLLRVLCLAAATWLLSVPLLRLVGGVLLLWITWKLLAPRAHGELPPADGATDEAPVGRSLGEAIRVIVVADVSMSIDNVLAVTAAANGHLLFAVAGVALSIPVVVWGSAILSRIMVHHPWIVWLGGGVLGHVAGVLIVEDPQVQQWFGAVAEPAWHWLPLLLAALCAATGIGAASWQRRRPA